MAFKAYDFNQPLMDNRDEVIFVKMYGGIRNASEVLFYTMMLDGGVLMKDKYPGLMEVLNLKDRRKIYDFTDHFTMINFMKRIRKPKPELSDQEICNDIAKMMGVANPWNASHTSLELGLYHIKDYDFLKKVYLCDIGGQTKEYGLLASSIFHDHIDRVYVLEKSFTEAMNDLPDITTAYVDDADELMSYLEYCEGANEIDKLKDKQFFVRANPVWAKDDKGNLLLPYADYFESAPERFKCQVTWMNSHYVDMTDPNPGVTI